MEDVIERIVYTINKIRPYIRRDGGDVEFVNFEDGVVSIRMFGACVGCSMVDSTITDGIEALLKDEIPEVKSVKLEENPFF